MGAEAKPTFPVPRGVLTLGEQETPPHVCVALRTKQEHQRPSPQHPSSGMVTHFPDHPGRATSVPVPHEGAIFVGQEPESSCIFRRSKAYDSSGGTGPSLC